MLQVEPTETLKVFIYQEDNSRHESITNGMPEGFEVDFFFSVELLYQAIVNELPHIVMLPFDPLKRDLMDLINKTNEVSSDIQIVCSVSTKTDKCIYDALALQTVDDFFYDSENEQSYIWSIRRAVERLGLVSLIREGSLKEKAKILNGLQKKLSAPATSALVTQFNPLFDEQKWVKLFLSESSRVNGFCPTIYLKFYEKNQSLHVYETSFARKKDFSGMGINLTQLSSSSKEQLFVSPQDNQDLSELLKIAFEIDSFQAFVVRSSAKNCGIVVFADSGISSELLESQVAEFRLGLEHISLRSDMYSSSEVETQTKLYHRRAFEKYVATEMQRASRIGHPLSLVCLRFEGPLDFTKNSYVSLLEGLKRNSRPFDVFGRLSAREVGILLPHTDIDQARKKCTRINTLLKMVMEKKLSEPLEYCFGLVEYPSYGHSQLQVIEAAQSACDVASEQGDRALCVYEKKTPGGAAFTTDKFYQESIRKEVLSESKL